MTDEKTIQQLFPGLEEGLYEEMIQHGTVKHAPAGDILLNIGQPIRSTMLVLEGVVKLYQEDGDGNEFFYLPYSTGPGLRRIDGLRLSTRKKPGTGKGYDRCYRSYYSVAIHGQVAGTV